jgi:hypothetical protein
MNKKFDQKEESTVFVASGLSSSSVKKKIYPFIMSSFSQSFYLLACARNFSRICPDQCVLLTPENSRDRDFMQKSSGLGRGWEE